MDIKVEKITPAKAAKYLERNSNNRPLNRRRVRELAGIMTARKWILNGQGISFGTTGVLLDGQHRLAAVVLSKVTIEIMVCRNLPTHVFTTIDQQRKRTASDMYSMAGLTRTAARSSTIRALQQLSAYSPNLHSGGVQLPHDVSIRVAESLPELGRSLTFVLSNDFKAAFNKVGRPAIWRGLHHVSCHYEPKGHLGFWTPLVTGENLSAGSPMLALRKRLTGYRADLPAVKQSQNRIFATVIYCWNSWHKGKSLRSTSVPAKVKNLPRMLPFQWWQWQERFEELCGE